MAHAHAAALAGLMLLGSFAARAQEAPQGGPQEGPAAAPAEEHAKPKRKPRPKPKPAHKPAPPPAAEDNGLRGAPDGDAPDPRPGGRGEAAPFAREQGQEKPFAPEAPDAPARPPASGAVVACEAGQAVLYDGPAGFSFWVTRSGSVTIDNPLRPLTPDVTRVLQLVIGDKLATAYGRDLTVLRRGASPGALEGLLGGPIRWDAALTTLPDGLDIVADSGAPLAQMRFKECGTAPAAKAPPVAAGKAARPRKKEGRPETAPDEKPRPGQRAPGAEQAGAPAGGAPPPRRLNLPQGAISE